MVTLTAAILALLTLPSGHGVAACRPRCAEHAEALAHAIEGAADAHGIWDCFPAGYVELSADDVIEVLRKECPHWFAEVP